MRGAIDDGGEVRCAAVTLAEVCRGATRTRRVEAALARRRGGQPIRIVPTDEEFAKLVGAILHDAGCSSQRIADAHVVAACTTADAAIVLTADPDDITTLAAAIPGNPHRHPESRLTAVTFIVGRAGGRADLVKRTAPTSLG